MGTPPEPVAVKEVIFDEAGMWESINGYKVLKATTLKIPNSVEAMHKLDGVEVVFSSEQAEEGGHPVILEFLSKEEIHEQSGA